MEFKILGPLEVRHDGVPIAIPALKQRAVLAVLLIGANRVIPVDHLVYELWGDAPPAHAKAVLQGYVSSLRRLLEPARPPRALAEVLVSRASGYALVVDPDRFDSPRFEALVAQGHSLLGAGQAESAQRALDAGLLLWRGPALADFVYEPFAQPEASRLEELRAVCLEDRVECDLDLGRHAAAAAELETMVGQRPLRERRWALLMVALYRAGRQGEALRTYERARRVLREELGIDPGPGLRRLEAAILAQDSSLDRRLSTFEPAALAPTPTPTRVRIQAGRAAPAIPLPHFFAAAGVMPFVGRASQLARLRSLWAEVSAGCLRVAVLGGEPGAGKTRLAAELARTVVAEGAVVLAGRCDEDLDVPFQPILEALRHLADHAPDNRRLGRHGPDLVRLLPELADRFSLTPSSLISDAATERYRLFGAVAACLAMAGAGNPVLLVLDDLQWASPETLLLLRHVVRSPEPTRVLVVACHRDTDLRRGRPLAELLADLRREPAIADRVPVDSLEVGDVEDLIAVTGCGDGDSAVAIHTLTAGNAFLVGEMLGCPMSTGAVDWRVPDGIRDWVGRRLSRMPDATHEVVVHASVTGVQFDLDDLVAATGSEPVALLRALDELTAARLLADGGNESPDRYRFRHPVVRQAIYEGLSPARRAALVRRIADATDVSTAS